MAVPRLVSGTAFTALFTAVYCLYSLPCDAVLRTYARLMRTSDVSLRRCPDGLIAGGFTYEGRVILLSRWIAALRELWSFLNGR